MVDMFFDKILKMCYTQKMLLKNAENKQKQKLSKFILQMVMVSLAALIGGANFKNFFEPAGIIPTGISGLALIIRNALASVGLNLPTAVIYLIFNLIIFLFALKIFGWKFLVLSGLGIGFYTLGMQFITIPVIANAAQSDVLLYAIVGAIIGGISVGIAMKFGGTTGGSDIAGVIINRYFPKIKTGYCLLLINAVVLTLSILTAGLQTGLYALVVAVINSLTTNLVLDGSKRVIAHYIICDKDEEIAHALLERYHRGVTKLDGTGMFSKKNKSILLCLLPNEQSTEMKRIVSSIDENCFVFSSVVTETIGSGEFMKEQSIFKNKIRIAEKTLKTENKYQRKELIKKLKLKRRQKRFKMPAPQNLSHDNIELVNSSETTSLSETIDGEFENDKFENIQTENNKPVNNETEKKDNND